MKFKKNKSNNLVWKSVELDEGFINKGVENLIGIEELTDYSIVQGKIIPNVGSKNVSLNKKNLKKDKLKKSKGEDNVEEQGTSDTEKQPVEKNKLKKKKKKNKNKIKLKPFSVDKIEQNEKENEEDGLEDENEGPKSKKAKIDLSESIEGEEHMEGMEAWSSYGLPKPLLKALHVQGFTQPTMIQKRTLPPAILGRKDILGAAETGSGKTLAFGLPILYGILKKKEQYNQPKLWALVLTPTRELAIQVGRHLTSVARFTSIRVSVLVGGLAPERQQRLLKKRPDIVVATPGRLWELLEDGDPHLSEGVNSLHFLAIDETDRMLERGHFQELQQLLQRLNTASELAKSRQNFVFSATLTLTHDPVRRKRKITSEQKLNQVIKDVGMSDPKIVDITTETRTASALTESRIQCSIDEKDLYLYYFITRHAGRSLVFCNSVGCVRRLTNLLTILQCRPFPLHASLAQRQRLKNLERFQENPNGLLLATDVAARGLDIPGVEHVIHYQVPRTAESYVHRSGRTARGKADGLTLVLVEPSEEHQYLRLWKTLGKSIQTATDFPVDPTWLSSIKKRVNLARKLDKADWTCRRANADRGWVEKAKHEMDIILDEDDAPQRASDETCTKMKRQVNMLRKELSILLAKPLITSGKILEGTEAALPLAKAAGEKKRKRPKIMLV